MSDIVTYAFILLASLLLIVVPLLVPVPERTQNSNANSQTDDAAAVVVRRAGGYRLRVIDASRLRHGECRDCYWLRGAISWWCKNDEAIDAHGTSIPGRTDCRFWESPR